MIEFIKNILNNPLNLGAITSAVISACVAIIVVVLSHWTNIRRSNQEHLTRKLEELYLILNKAAEENLERLKAIKSKFVSEKVVETDIDKSYPDIYGLILYKKMIMYVRLYFPKLEQAHKELLMAQQELNSLIYKMTAARIPTMDEFEKAAVHIGDKIKSMEDEIINNKQLLTGRNNIFHFYKRAS